VPLLWNILALAQKPSANPHTKHKHKITVNHPIYLKHRSIYG